MSKRFRKRIPLLSRRKRDILIAAFIITAALLIWLDRTGLEQLTGISRQGRDTAGDYAKYNEKTFLVTNVVDGDTIDIDVSDGNDVYTRIRLLGVDTPETKHPQLGVQYYGPQAYEFTKQMTLNKNVTLYLIEGDTRGYYGRLLAYVKLPDGSFLNELLISEGYGYAYLPYDHLYYNQYKQLESAAKREKKGLWKEITVDKMPPWRQKYEE